ncbi:MAG: YbgC/FadM family acyl-CoA thioesterase [Pseudomonadota bacterium]
MEYRIYFEDTDVTGVVYHANYLRYFERGRTESLRACFSDLSALMEAEDPCTFVVSSINIDYKRPAKLDDVITVDTFLESARGPRMVFTQTIFRGDDVLAKGTVTAAVITLDGRPRRMPKAMAARMEELLA